jgi:hypothetical protein
MHELACVEVDIVLDGSVLLAWLTIQELDLLKQTLFGKLPVHHRPLGVPEQNHLRVRV